MYFCRMKSARQPIYEFDTVLIDGEILVLCSEIHDLLTDSYNNLN